MMKDNAKEFVKYFLKKVKILEEKGYHKAIIPQQQGNDIIAKHLKSGNPFMVCRFGSTELNCVYHYLNNFHVNGWDNGLKETMLHIGGLFPMNDENMTAFTEIFVDALKHLDILGVWRGKEEGTVIENYCSDAKLVPLRSIEPYYHNSPWSKHLEGKTVLVVNPFARLIESQYQQKREQLFKDQQLLPLFTLKTIKSPYTIPTLKHGYTSWFQAYDELKDSVLSTEFDVAIVGAGPYGLPLSSEIKKSGKSVIHMGGATQVLFGIKGGRWDNHDVISKLYNDSWVRPSTEDRPENYKKIDNASYW